MATRRHLWRTAAAAAAAEHIQQQTHHAAETTAYICAAAVNKRVHGSETCPPYVGNVDGLVLASWAWSE